jgi:hypothetical protein
MEAQHLYNLQLDIKILMAGINGQHHKPGFQTITAD